MKQTSELQKRIEVRAVSVTQHWSQTATDPLSDYSCSLSVLQFLLPVSSEMGCAAKLGMYLPFSSQIPSSWFLQHFPLGPPAWSVSVFFFEPSSS